MAGMANLLLAGRQPCAGRFMTGASALGYPGKRRQHGIAIHSIAINPLWSRAEPFFCLHHTGSSRGAGLMERAAAPGTAPAHDDIRRASPSSAQARHLHHHPGDGNLAHCQQVAQ